MANNRLDLERAHPADEVSLARPGFYEVASYADLDHYGYGESADNDAVHLRDLWRMVRKHKWLVLVIMLIATTIVTIEMYRTKSTYQGVTIIEMGKDTPTLVKAGDMIIQGDDVDLFGMKTQILVIKSRPLLEDVVVNLKLDQNPKFMEITERHSFWEALGAIGGKVTGEKKMEIPDDALNMPEIKPEGGLDRSPSERARLAPFVAVLARNLDVDQIKDTRALKVSFTHTDPVLAAAVANGVAQDFIQRNFQSKTEKFTNTSNWLDRSTRELKSQVRQAEQELANYTRQHNIFSTDGKESLTTEKLAKLHSQVMEAETNRILKHSLYEEVKQGRVAQLPEAFADPKTGELQRKLGELATTSAQLSVKFGQKNPRVVEVQQQMAAIQEQIDGGRKTLEEKLKADYERAARDEGSLRAALDRAKGEAVQQNQAAIQLGILRQNVETAKSLYTDFLQKTNQANVQVAEQHNNLRIIEPAVVPRVPVGPKRLLVIMAGFLLSLAGGVGLAFFLEYLDNTVKSIEDVSRYAQLPTLAVIPAINASISAGERKNGHRKALATNGTAAARESKQGLVTALDTRSYDTYSLGIAAEAYRTLRTSVLLSTAGGPPKTILVTSGQPGEGKTTTTINTAISLAQLGASVLVIDADLRRPTTHKVLGVNQTAGLSTYLSSDTEVDKLITKLEIPNLSLLPCGPIPPNPSELISSEKMKQLLGALSQRFDHILIDSPPLIHVTDPVILSTMVDGVILVVRGGKSTRDVVRFARQELTRVGSKVFGVVLNSLDLKKEGYDYYYGYGGYSSYLQKGTGTNT